MRRVFANALQHLQTYLARGMVLSGTSAYVRRSEERATVYVIGPAPVLVIRPDVDTVSGPEVIGPASLPSIAPAPRAVWDDRGWTQRQEGSRMVYDGAYQIRRQSGMRVAFRGQVITDGRSVVAYIVDPPAEIRRHAKGPCFQLTTPPWFRVHWHRPARNVDDAILYIERILAEVLR